MDSTGAYNLSTGDGTNGYTPDISFDRIPYDDPTSIQEWALGSAMHHPYDTPGHPHRYEGIFHGQSKNSIDSGIFPIPCSHPHQHADGGRAMNVQAFNPPNPQDDSFANAQLDIARITDESGHGTYPVYGPRLPMPATLDQCSQDVDLHRDHHPYYPCVEKNLQSSDMSQAQVTVSQNSQCDPYFDQGWDHALNCRKLLAGPPGAYAGQQWASAIGEQSPCASQASFNLVTPTWPAMPDRSDFAGDVNPPPTREPAAMWPSASMLPGGPGVASQTGSLAQISANSPPEDMYSTIRPGRGAHRSNLPSLWTHAQVDLPNQAYGSPVSMFTNSRRTSEGEPLSARTHKLYQLKASEDGRYHCNFSDPDTGKDCEHESFKLKCNYE